MYHLHHLANNPPACSCTVLNSVGVTWTGLIATASCGLFLVVFVFSWIGRCVRARDGGNCLAGRPWQTMPLMPDVSGQPPPACQCS